MNLQSIPSPANALIGSVRRFGPHGVLYQVVDVVDDRRALIRVLDTGEETTYSLEHVLADPTS